MSVGTFGQKVRTWVETDLTAIGSTQANAFPLNNNTQNEFTTVGSGTGCILPMAYPSPPSQISVFNAGSNALAVYPPLGGTINGGTVNAPYSLAAGTGLTYWASSLSNWYSVQSSSSGGSSGTVSSGSSGQVAYYGSSGTAVSGEALLGLDRLFDRQHPGRCTLPQRVGLVGAAARRGWPVSPNAGSRGKSPVGQSERLGHGNQRIIRAGCVLRKLRDGRLGRGALGLDRLFDRQRPGRCALPQRVGLVGAGARHKWPVSPDAGCLGKSPVGQSEQRLGHGHGQQRINRAGCVLRKLRDGRLGRGALGLDRLFDRQRPGRCALPQRVGLVGAGARHKWPVSPDAGCLGKSPVGQSEQRLGHGHCQQRDRDRPRVLRRDRHGCLGRDEGRVRRHQQLSLVDGAT